MEYGSLEVREIGRFIRTRREEADPDRFQSLPRRRRHVPHLTQGDLAELAGVSSVVVSQIEQARYPNLNASILRKLAQAMQLPTNQQTYMMGLLNSDTFESPTNTVPHWVQSTTDDTMHPVTIINPSFDILAWNRQALSLLGDFSQAPPDSRNVISVMFLAPHMPELMVEIDRYRTNLVSGLKMWFSQYPAYRQRIMWLARTMEEQSEAFRQAWDTADPFTKPTLEKRMNHPSLGPLQIYELVGEIVGESGLIKIEFLPADDATRAAMTQL